MFRGHFRIFGHFLICFRKFDWKSDTRHSFLEFVAKSGQNFIKNSQKNANSMQKIKKSEIHLFIREKMLTIFGWNFEIWAVQKYVNLVDLVKSFPTSIYLQKSASIQPRTSLSKFGGKFNSLFIRLVTLCTKKKAVRTKDRIEYWIESPPKFGEARSRLYRRRFLQVNTHFAAFVEIYKISIPLHLLNPKRKTMKSHFIKAAARTGNTSRKIVGNKRCAQARGAAEKARENGKRPELNYTSRRYITRIVVGEPEAH